MSVCIDMYACTSSNSFKRPGLLTQDREHVRVDLGLPEGLVGGVTGEHHVPVDGWHAQFEAADRMPAARPRPLAPRRGLGARLPVHHPRHLRGRVRVLHDARQRDVLAHSGLCRPRHHHLVGRNCGGTMNRRLVTQHKT